MNIEYKRTCPSCNKEITYSFSSGFYYAKKHNSLCKSCSKKGQKAWNKGILATDETKERLLKCHLGKKQSEITRHKRSEIRKKLYNNPIEVEKLSKLVKKSLHRPDIRKKHLDALHNSQWLKVKTDNGQIELLKKWNSLGFNFEPNYQVKTDQDLFYIDGYDKKRNIVLEYDSKYHSKLSQKQRDLVRQNKIIEILKPNKFWRYNDVSKSWTNII